MALTSNLSSTHVDGANPSNCMLAANSRGPYGIAAFLENSKVKIGSNGWDT